MNRQICFCYYHGNNRSCDTGAISRSLCRRGTRVRCQLLCANRYKRQDSLFRTIAIRVRIVTIWSRFKMFRMNVSRGSRDKCSLYNCHNSNYSLSSPVRLRSGRRVRPSIRCSKGHRGPGEDSNVSCNARRYHVRVVSGNGTSSPGSGPRMVVRRTVGVFKGLRCPRSKVGPSRGHCV